MEFLSTVTFQQKRIKQSKTRRVCIKTVLGIFHDSLQTKESGRLFVPRNLTSRPLALMQLLFIRATVNKSMFMIMTMKMTLVGNRRLLLACRIRLMTRSLLYPCGKPCSRGTHNETVIILALFSSIINGIMKESRLRISIP